LLAALTEGGLGHLLHTFVQAKDWLKQRVPFLHRKSKDEIFFANINARSFSPLERFCAARGRPMMDLADCQIIFAQHMKGAQQARRLL
jgi:hypothetical protein